MHIAGEEEQAPQRQDIGLESCEHLPHSSCWRGNGGDKSIAFHPDALRIVPVALVLIPVQLFLRSAGTVGGCWLSLHDEVPPSNKISLLGDYISGLHLLVAITSGEDSFHAGDVLEAGFPQNNNYQVIGIPPTLGNAAQNGLSGKFLNLNLGHHDWKVHQRDNGYQHGGNQSHPHI